MDNTNITEIRQLLSLNHYPCFDLIKMSITIKEAIKKKRDKNTSLSLANLTVLMMQDNVRFKPIVFYFEDFS